MKLITTLAEGEKYEYNNAITEELDSLVFEDCKASIEYGGGTYLLIINSNKIISIRFPGATRGGITLDENNIITEIMLFDDEMANKVQCYDRKAYDAIKKYLGAEIIFEEK